MVSDKVPEEKRDENSEETKTSTSGENASNSHQKSEENNTRGKKARSLLMPALVRQRRKAVQYDSSSEDQEELVDSDDSNDKLIPRGSKKRTWKCVFCPNVFSDRGALVSHCKIHSGNRNYNCPCCEKKFKKAEACNLHFNEHFVMKCFSCRYCGRRFAHLGNLWNHKMMHVELNKRAKRKENIWTCDKCSQTFVLKTDLVHHHMQVGPCFDPNFNKSVEEPTDPNLAEMFFFLGSIPNNTAERTVGDVETTYDADSENGSGNVDEDQIRDASSEVSNEPQSYEATFTIATFKQ